MGIEPTSSAWKAEVLPLNYTRLAHALSSETSVQKIGDSFRLVEGGGFTPCLIPTRGIQPLAPSGPPRLARRSKSLQAIS